MYDFAYHKPSSVADAVAARSGAEDGTYVAGGMTLVPTLKQRLAQPSDLVDLGAIGDLKGISVSGDTVTIGAMTTHGAVAESSDVQSVVPALAKLAGSIGDPQVRNRGTIGGSVANNDPAADYPAACLALGATIKTDKREVPAAEFFTGLFETALDEGEMIVSISFPKPEKAGYQKFINPASRYALVGVFVAKTAGGVKVAVTGAGQDGVFSVPEMESALSANLSADALDGIVVDADMLNSDIHASAEYRSHLITVMAKRAVAGLG